MTVAINGVVRSTVLLVILFCNPLDRELHIPVGNIMAVEEVLQELQRFGPEGVSVLSEDLRASHL